MKILEDIYKQELSLKDIDFRQVQMIIEQQNKALLEIYKLLLFDDRQINASSNKLAKAFLDTQLRALEHINNVINKYKDEIEKIKPKKKLITNNTKVDKDSLVDDEDIQTGLF